VAHPTPRFTIGEIYRRRVLHEEFGGQRQGGISTPSDYPIVFLFTGESGQQYGYHDGYQDDTGIFLYTGEGQTGSMQLTRGNRAIAEHQQNGEELHLFETAERGYVRYVGPATYLGHTWRTAPDRTGTPRNAIVFELAIGDEPVGTAIALRSESSFPRALWSQSLESLRRLALEISPRHAAPEERKRNVYQRSEAVKVYVLRRSKGTCEGCGQPAPFKRSDGSYYLEPHHIRRVADSGPDHPQWVAALCPNCHRRVHYGEDGTSFNDWLARRINEIE
jgi:5-methylcytosine-specific restriction protein A